MKRQSYLRSLTDVSLTREIDRLRREEAVRILTHFEQRDRKTLEVEIQRRRAGKEQTR